MYAVIVTRGTTREQRYHAKVDVRGPDECWPWLAGTNEHGYGTFRGDNGDQLAHRYGYKLLVGPLEPGQCVCHSCDNPPCQNPRHWFPGTNLDNIADMVNKGRHSQHNRDRLACFPKRAREKISDEQVAELRRQYVAGSTQQELAAAYRMTQAAVGAIVRGKKRASAGGPVCYDNLERRGGRGLRHPNATLSDKQVAAIRNEYARGGVSQATLGKRYNVSQVAISRYVRGECRASN